MVHVARRAEQLGYHSLWTFQRLLVPADLGWSETYHSVQDPLTTLAFLAAHTTPRGSGSAWRCSTCRSSLRCCWPSRPRLSTSSPADGSTWDSASAGRTRSIRRRG
ncbi:hypothetical protein AB0C04_16805 [Micromonospora sp. NPDC048909]|uniref:hypothetical protein n=1 Tax=Micromonospora sp. NPDC048909 TaxID=3155643 RepID=UPI0033C5A460